MADLSVNLAGLHLDNPVIPASGTFGYGKEFARYYDLNVLGSFSFKGTTLHPRKGNDLPRIAETPSGMLNSVGLQNPGVDEVIQTILPEMPSYFHKSVIANVSGFSEAEYVEVSRRLSGQEQVGMIELNISCPNVSHGGMSFGTDPSCAAQVVRAVRRAVKKPLFVKLTPNVTDICEIARACEGEGADGLSLINTLMGMRIDLKTRRPILANGTGGLSGPAVFPVAVHMVYAVRKAVKIPIMGMGGVTCARDVIEMMLSGATAVQVGAANLVDPFACPKIIAALPEEMAKWNIKSLSQIIGGAV